MDSIGVHMFIKSLSVSLNKLSTKFKLIIHDFPRQNFSIIQPAELSFIKIFFKETKCFIPTEKEDYLRENGFLYPFMKRPGGPDFAHLGHLSFQDSILNKIIKKID